MVTNRSIDKRWFIIYNRLIGLLLRGQFSISLDAVLGTVPLEKRSIVGLLCCYTWRYYLRSKDYTSNAI